MARKLGDAAVEIIGQLNEASFRDSQAKIAKTFHDVNVTAAVRLDAAKAQADLAKLAKKRNIDIGVSVDEAQKAVIDAKLDVLTRKRDAEIKPVVDTSVFGKLKSLFGMAGSDASDEFNKSLKGGGGGGAGMMSPQVILPLVGLGLAALPGAFAIVGGLAAVAFGGALALKGSPVLQKAGKTLIGNLETTMEGAAKVLDKPIASAFTQIQGQLPVFGKLFSQTFSAVAPLVKPLVTMLTEIVVGIMPGFNSLMKQSAKPLSDFFVNAGKIVGTGLGKFLAGLGPGVGPSLKAIQSLLTLFVDILPPTAQLAVIFAKVLGPALEGLVGLINLAEKAWAKIPAPIKNIIVAVLSLIDPIQQVAHVVGQFGLSWPQLELVALKGLKGIVDGMSDFTGTFLHLASDAFGWIPGIGPKLKTASKDFDSWRSSVDKSLQSVIDKTQDQINSAKLQQILAGQVAKSWDNLSGHIKSAADEQNLTTAQTDALTSAMKTNKNNVDTSKTSFDSFTKSLGLSTKQANALWGQLKQASGNYAANVVVKVTGGGAVKVTEAVAATLGAIDQGSTPTPTQVQGAKDRQTAGVGPSAALNKAVGGYIVKGMGPAGKDSVNAKLAPGELVIPTSHAAKFGDMARRASIPGFAGGGIMGASSSFSQAPSVGKSLGAIQEPQYAGALASSVGTQVANALGAAMKAGLSAAEAAAAAGPTGGPAGGATGSEMANGRELYSYLLANVFGGAKIAAAGAIASIWGESTWNPFAQGTGGRGLIGWTPPGSISDAAFSGGMKTQEPAIIRFITTSGDWGAISEMKGATSILDAANIWGKRVERYGINDVHSTGLALAAQIMGQNAAPQVGGVSTSPVTGEKTFNGYSYARGGIAGKAFNLGGVIPEKILGFGTRTGTPFSFGSGERVSRSGSPNDDPVQIAKATNALLASVGAKLDALNGHSAQTANNTRNTANGINGAGRNLHL